MLQYLIYFLNRNKSGKYKEVEVKSLIVRE